MKRILIISEYFAPQNTIAAVRSTKLAKYLKMQGNNHITVITKKSQDIVVDELLLNDLKYIDKVIYCNLDHIMFGINRLINHITQTQTYKVNVQNSILPNNDNNKNNIKKILYNKIKYVRSVMNSISYSNKAFKTINRSTIGQFDIVFSTYGPFSSHLIGMKLKKKLPQIYWIADFRDQVYTNNTPKLFEHYCKSFIKKSARVADMITAVSTGVMDSLELNNLTKKIVISNGFDRDDLPTCESSNDISDGKLRLLYTGQMYQGKRDLSLFFRALSKLINGKYIDPNRIEIGYAGFSFDEYIRQAYAFGLQDLVLNHGYVSREHSIQLQKESHILLLASWNRMGSTGVVTGKVFEYILVNNPIICIVTGDIPNCELKNIIESTKMGICCEEANGEIDYLRLEDYLFKKYCEFVNNGFISLKPDYDQIENYNYSNLAKRLCENLQ